MIGKLTAGTATALSAAAALTLWTGLVGAAAPWSQSGPSLDATHYHLVSEGDVVGSRVPIEDVVATVRKEGYGEIYAVDIEHGRYEVKARDPHGQIVELFLDLKSGELFRDAATGKPLFKRVGPIKGTGTPLSVEHVVAQVEAAGYTGVYSIEYEHSLYEVKALDPAGRKVELYVHPKSGELLKHPRTGEPLAEEIE